jgi:hypothetical protein
MRGVLCRPFGTRLIHVILPGTDVPGYRLFRRYGTGFVVVSKFFRNLIRCSHLSRSVALSNFMQLSLRESLTRGRGKYRVVGNPGDAGANVGHPYGVVMSAKDRGEGLRYPTRRKEREGWGTRRLVAGIEPKASSSPTPPESGSMLKSETWAIHTIAASKTPILCAGPGLRLPSRPGLLEERKRLPRPRG